MRESIAVKLRALKVDVGVYEQLAQVMDDSARSLVLTNDCPVTAAAFVDCLAEICKVLIRSGSMSKITLGSCYWRVTNTIKVPC